MALTDYDKQHLSAEAQEGVRKYTEAWEKARAAGDEAGMQAANEGANAWRATANYSGGMDGTQIRPVNTDERAYSIVMTGGRYDNARPGANAQDLTEVLRAQKAAELAANLNGLKRAYVNSLNGYKQREAELPEQFNAARRSAAAQDALARAAFDERAIASGLSSGARGQADLSRSAALQSALGQLDRQQAGAAADLRFAMEALSDQYRTARAGAQAENAAALSEALYNELVRQGNLNREAEDREIAMAQLAAQYGDYSRLRDLGINMDAYLGALGGGSTGGNVNSGGGSGGGTQRSGGSGYNNGGLSAEDVMAVQRYFGLDPDGYWGARSQSTGYASAADAQAAMLAALGAGIDTTGAAAQGGAQPFRNPLAPGVNGRPTATPGTQGSTQGSTQDGGQAFRNPLAPGLYGSPSAANPGVTLPQQQTPNIVWGNGGSAPLDFSTLNNPYASESDKDRAVVNAARTFVESNPGGVAWDRLDAYLNQYNLTAAQRELFKAYVRNYTQNTGR